MFDIAPTIDCRGRALVLDRPRVMGVINVTPDSFSDGGAFLDADAAIAHGLKLAELVFDRLVLRIRADPAIECDALCHRFVLPQIVRASTNYLIADTPQNGSPPEGNWQRNGGVFVTALQTSHTT